VQPFAQLIAGCRGQNRVSLFVRKPVCASNYAVRKARAFCTTVFVEMNKYRMREPIDAGIETADAVAQSLRQHRDYTVREVNAVSAPARFSIQRAVGLHISGDVGDVYTEAPTASGLLNVNCVVEIARVIGIDGDDEFSAQIFASLELSTINCLGNSLRLVQNIPGKFRWQMIFPDDRQHVDPRSRSRAEHFDDFTFGINVPRFPGFQANYNFIANLWRNLRSCERQVRHGGSGLRQIRNLPHINVVHDARIIRDHIIKVPRTLESADNRIVSALQDSNHAPLTPPFDAAVRFVRRYSRDHTVAVHGCSGVFRGDENVRLPRHF
jgi:hypothetical protein